MLQLMDAREAIEKACYILDEEQTSPTIDYRYDSDEWPRELWYEALHGRQDVSPRFSAHLILHRLRDRSKREVFEHPNRWKFESTNYPLLMTLNSQLADVNRASFISALLNIYARKYVPATRNPRVYGAWNGQLSALPLLAEFCVRNGHLSLLLEAISKIDLPNANLVNMLAQLQEIVSLNFNVFSEADLKHMAESLRPLREMAETQTWEFKQGREGKPVVRNDRYKKGFSAAGGAVVAGVDSFLELCRKAHYFYVRDGLQQNRNPEIESDKMAVLDI